MNSRMTAIGTSLASLSWLLCAGALSSGCAVEALETPEEEGADVGETDQAVIRASATLEAPWAVQLVDDTACTAEALTRHWLITAAHCVFGKPAFKSGRTVQAVNPSSGAMTTVF
nr:trypsin-like serine protease [Myxococcota bacterium]